MPNSQAQAPSRGHTDAEVYENVACPFCGMLCDDLEIERNRDSLEVRKASCARARAGFERKLPPAAPLLDGKPASLADAIQAAARLLRESKSPLFGGLATDVEGMRAALSLAERAGGIVDHAASEAQYRNYRILQSTGWTTSTLTETRNRADLIIVVGADLQTLHPRFFERIVAPGDSMFEGTLPTRTLVFLGPAPDNAASLGKQIGEVVTLDVPQDKVGDALAVLRARLRGAPVQHRDIGKIGLADIEALAQRCREAKYGVVVWAPASLDFPFAELAVEQITGLVKDLNQTTRFAGLSLGGAEGATTAASVTAWQSGYPLRVSFANGHPDYDPHRYAISRMLAAGEGDLLVWIASFSPELVPPATDLPTIVLGTPGMTLSKLPAVFIPVGTPGVDHAGRLVRVDNVVTLPLKNLHRAALPSAAEILAQIEAAL